MEVETPKQPPRSIRLLDPAVIHRIAAGEVVDRPASILKELVENSIDAGATKVRITLIDGGLRSIQVEDDGYGISFDDLGRCVQRHATSKISTLQDLEEISSLGFRGEALSAAASVSHLIIETFSVASGAWVLEVVGGDRKEIVPGTRRLGTKISVNDLFFNIPARRKFLKRASLEASDSVATLEFMALVFPEIFFEWYILGADGEVKESRKLQPTTLAQRFAEISELKAQILEIQHEKLDDGLKKVEIVAAFPPAASATQKSVRLAVNGRALMDKRLPYALREAYAGLIEIGQFPWVFVRVQADPSVIDVNIHPQKKEIRWPQGFSLPSLVYHWIRPHFESKAPAPLPQVEQENFFESAEVKAPSAPIQISAGEFLSPSREFSVPTAPPTFVPSEAEPENSVPRLHPSQAQPPFRFRELRVVGEVGAAWILCESAQGMVVIDQHAAHERVQFERILARPELLRPRMLLIPLELKIPLSAQSYRKELVAALESLHFEIADTSTKTVLEILAVPEGDRKISWSDWLKKAFELLREESSVESLLSQFKSQVAASLACHGSVRRGQRLGLESIKSLLEQMDEVRWGGLCPHGRPLWFELSHEKIEEIFHRS